MTIRTPGEGSVQHRAAAFLHFQRNNQMPSVSQLCSTPSRAPTPAQLVPGPQMPPRRSSATSCTPGKSPFSPSVRKENPAKPTGRIQQENPAPSLDPSRQLSPLPKRLPLCMHAGGPPCLVADVQCALCHKPLSKAKLFRRGSKLWDDSLSGWAAAGRLTPSSPHLHPSLWWE